jgi:hypothetical protein
MEGCSKEHCAEHRMLQPHQRLLQVILLFVRGITVMYCSIVLAQWGVTQGMRCTPCMTIEPMQMLGKKPMQCSKTAVAPVPAKD